MAFPHQDHSVRPKQSRAVRLDHQGASRMSRGQKSKLAVNGAIARSLKPFLKDREMGQPARRLGLARVFNQLHHVKILQVYPKWLDWPNFTWAVLCFKPAWYSHRFLGAVLNTYSWKDSTANGSNGVLKNLDRQDKILNFFLGDIFRTGCFFSKKNRRHFCWDSSTGPAISAVAEAFTAGWSGVARDFRWVSRFWTWSACCKKGELVNCHSNF